MKQAVATPVWSSSIGRKIVMSLSGLFLITFLIAHLAGNLLLLKNDGGEAFNAYAEFMSTSPLIRVAEIIMFAGFILHIAMAFRLNNGNTAARPVPYKVKKPNHASFYSRFMIWSGTTVLLFLVIHLANFFVKHRIVGHEGMTLYDLTSETFRFEPYAIFYVVSMFFLTFHLAHGFQSGFQSLGLQVNKKIHRTLNAVGLVLSILICGGFAMIPLYFLLQKYS
jgi:succinate dehydrogenase / fumarate reductase cytochrome b subunit